MTKPRHALQLLESELASFVSMLSHEAGGILLRILDIQNRTGMGLPDGRSTHMQLGLPKRRWILLREELQRVVTSEGGYLVFKPMLERRAKLSQARAKAGANGAQASVASRSVQQQNTNRPHATSGQRAKGAEANTQTRPATSKTSTVNVDAGQPVPPFTVLDDANRQIAATSNVVKLHGDQPPQPGSPSAISSQAPKGTTTRGSRSKKPAQAILPGMGGTAAAEQGQPDDIVSARKTCFDVGIKLLTRYNGMTEETARFRIGKLLKDWDDHFVYAAIADAARHRDTLANPIGWIGNRLKDFPDKAACRAARVSKVTGKGTQAPPAKKAVPKATPDFMGISKQKAARLAERSNALRKGSEQRGSPSSEQPVPISNHQPANDTIPAKSDDQIFKVLAF